MKKMTGLTAALALSLSPWVASAQDMISYNYLQFDILADAELAAGGLDEDIDGFALEGSALVHPNIFVAAQSTRGEVDLGGGAGDAAVEQFSFGVGARMGLMESATSALDVYGSVNSEALSLAGPSLSGFGVTAGLRWMPVAQLEINPSVGYVDYGDSSALGGDLDAVRYQLRGLYHVTENVSVALDFRFEDLELSDSGNSADVDFDQIRVGARWTF